MKLVSNHGSKPNPEDLKKCLFLVQGLLDDVERYRRMWYQGPYAISTGSKRYLRKLDRRKARREKRDLLRQEMERHYEEGCLAFQEMQDDLERDALLDQSYWDDHLELEEQFFGEYSEYDLDDYFPEPYNWPDMY